VFWLANCFSSSQYSSASSRPLICSIHVVEWRMETKVMGTSPIATCTLCTSCRSQLKWHMRLWVSDTKLSLTSLHIVPSVSCIFSQLTLLRRDIVPTELGTEGGGGGGTGTPPTPPLGRYHWGRAAE